MSVSRSVLEEYLANKSIHELMKGIVNALCLERPEDPVEFVINFLQERSQALHGSAELSIPPVVADDIFDPTVPPAPESSPPPRSSSMSGAEFCDDGGEDELLIVPPANYQRKRRNAIAVSSSTSQLERAAPTTAAPMDWETRQQIDYVLHTNMLFSALDDHQRAVIMDAMQRQETAAGDVVIRQGDQGDRFFIIASGEVEFYISKPGSTGPDKVGSAGPGQSFGELALMHGSPRAATVVASAPCVFWVMDRDTYRNILMETVLAKRRRYQDFLARVPILGALEPYERATLTDALVPVTFQPGQAIVRQGDRGDTFYVIEEGEVLVTRQDPGMDAPVEVNRLRAAQFFGEVALLSAQQERRATVTALGPVRALSLDHASFTRLLGPLEEIMQRNVEQYHLCPGCGAPAAGGPVADSAAPQEPLPLAAPASASAPTAPASP